MRHKKLTVALQATLLAVPCAAAGGLEGRLDFGTAEVQNPGGDP